MKLGPVRIESSYASIIIATTPAIMAWVLNFDNSFLMFMYVFLSYLLLLDYARDVEEIKAKVAKTPDEDPRGGGDD